MCLKSFQSLHKSCSRATPEMIMKYKLALCLHKLYNERLNPIEFIDIDFNQIFTSQETTFKISKSNTYKVGVNALVNRLFHINNQIPLNWLNLMIETYKVYCKEKYISLWYLIPDTSDTWNVNLNIFNWLWPCVAVLYILHRCRYLI